MKKFTKIMAVGLLALSPTFAVAGDWKCNSHHVTQGKNLHGNETYQIECKKDGKKASNFNFSMGKGDTCLDVVGPTDPEGLRDAIVDALSQDGHHHGRILPSCNDSAPAPQKK